MAILVTGGAGYIGSHTVAELVAHGEDVVVIDNLSKGHRSAVQGAPLYEIDIRDSDRVSEVLQRHEIDTVVHFAADSLVGESVQVPLKYYDNNVTGTQRLLTVLVKHGIKRVVFSSSAATYGEPTMVPIPETHEMRPTNPYGETKLAIEHMLKWCFSAYGLGSISLRYFNAAGAHELLPIGEDHEPETHLIPIVLRAALGQLGAVQVFGDDYKTPDGTCTRDYVHVMDLASAHRLAVHRLRQTPVQEAYNLGNGAGFSVQEVIAAARKVTGQPIPTVIGARRAGDPAQLVASSEAAKKVLGWQPDFTDIEAIIASAWNWHLNHPNGFAE